MTSEEFLRHLGIPYWMLFSRSRMAEDCRADGRYLRTVTDRLLPLTPVAGHIEAVVGEHGDRRYEQHLAYQLSARILVVASSYRAATDTARTVRWLPCEMSFFTFNADRLPKWSQVSAASPLVLGTLEEWALRLKMAA